jgi:hypothetical protein
MDMRQISVFVLLILILFNSGCGIGKTDVRKFREIYAGDFNKISKIVIRNNETFQTKTLADKPTIDEWIRKVKDYTLRRDPIQAPRTGGFKYIIRFYEEWEDPTIMFQTNKVNDEYVIFSGSFLEAADELYQKAN